MPEEAKHLRDNIPEEATFLKRKYPGRDIILEKAIHLKGQHT
jgi:hypothetical protein